MKQYIPEKSQKCVLKLIKLCSENGHTTNINDILAYMIEVALNLDLRKCLYIFKSLITKMKKYNIFIEMEVLVLSAKIKYQKLLFLLLYTLKLFFTSISLYTQCEFN